MHPNLCLKLYAAANRAVGPSTKTTPHEPALYRPQGGVSQNLRSNPSDPLGDRISLGLCAAQTVHRIGKASLWNRRVSLWAP